MLYCVEVPISDYEQKQVFFKCLYFEGDRCPTYSEVLCQLNKTNQEERELQKTNPEYGPFCFEAAECISTLQKISPSNFPYLVGGQIMGNTFVEHPKFGKQSISVSKLSPYTNYRI